MLIVYSQVAGHVAR